MLARAILLLVAAVALVACESPPRMWGKRTKQFLSQEPADTTEATRAAYEQMARDAAQAETYAQLCGVDTRPFADRFRVYLRDRGVANHDIIWRAYQLEAAGLLRENLRARFPPGECWQRDQDYKAFVAVMDSGGMPTYSSFGTWR